MYKFATIILFVTGTLLFAQDIRVIDETKLDLEGKYSHAVFSPDSKHIYFTTDNYIGIWNYNIDTKSTRQITDKTGAGYQFCFSNDATNLVYRSDEFLTGRRISTIVERNLLTNSETIIESNLRNATPPKALASGQTVFAVDSEVRKAGNALESTTNDIAVLSRGYDILLIQGDRSRLVKPLGEKHYIWASLSPDGKKILFTVPGDGTYISDLSGSIIAELGYANAPRWSGDSQYIVFMKDYDDGHVVTDSDIYIIKADGTGETNLTGTDDRIELYPVWSPDGSKIGFNSAEGNIYYLTIETAGEE